MRIHLLNVIGTATRAMVVISVFASTAQAESIPCQGRYAAVSGSVALRTSEGAMVLTRQRNEGMVDLTYQGCDRISMVGSGRQMELLRSATEGWTATLQGGGATRYFTFSTLSPRLIDSWMVARGGGLTAERGMKLTLVSGTENQPTDCVFDSESESFSLENTAAQAFLAGRGLIPPSGEFTLRDYYRAAEVENSTESRDSTTRHIRFLLNADNSILPAARGKTVFRETCRAEPEALDSPRRLLNFKYYPVENPAGYSVFAQVIDIETGKILAQAEQVVTGRGDAALSRAMAGSVSQIEESGTQIGQLSNGTAP